MADFTPQEIEQFLQQFFDVVGARQYTGARYVPIFGRAGSDTVEWDDLAPYEPLTVVMHEGVSYVSRRYVPTGIGITNTDYWVETYRFNAQVEQYRQEVLSFQAQIDGIRSDYVPFPDPLTLPKYGTNGQVLSSHGDGSTEWMDPVIVTADVAAPLIDEWLDDHPEATTTVLDNSITDAKLVQTGGILTAAIKLKSVPASTTALSSLTAKGYYAVPGTLLSSLTDAPSRATSGMLVVFSNVRTGEDGNLIQLYVNANDGVIFSRSAAGGTFTEWVGIDEFRHGTPTGTNFSDVTRSGWYNITTAFATNANDAPEARAGALVVYDNVWNGNSGSVMQMFISSQSAIYVRMKANGASYSEWTKVITSLDYSRHTTPTATTALSTLTGSGWYNIPSTMVPNLTDAPSTAKSGMLLVYNNIRTGNNNDIIQLYVNAGDGRIYKRSGLNGTFTAWFDTDEFMHLSPSGTSFSDVTKSGWYNITTAFATNANDAPEARAGALVVYDNVWDGNSGSVMQMFISTHGNIYTRFKTRDTSFQPWTYMRRFFENEKNVTVIGDSISYGYYDDNGSLLIDTTRAWPHLLSFEGYNVTNLSIGGMGYIDPVAGTNEIYIDVIQGTDFTDCDVFIVCGGINDYKGDQPLGTSADQTHTTVLGAVNEIIAYMATNYPSTRLIFMSPFNSSRFGTLASKWSLGTANSASTPYTLSDMCDAIKGICETNGITYIDLATTGPYNFRTIKSQLTDDVHPSHEAQYGLASFVIAKVKAEISGLYTSLVY